MTVKANNSDGTTTKEKEIEVKDTPVKPINYYLGVNIIGSPYVDITFQNNSGKGVTTIELKIIAWNDFDERIATPYYYDDYTMGATASNLSFLPGTERTYTWKYLDIYFLDSITTVKAYVTRIAYADETSWSLE